MLGWERWHLHSAPEIWAVFPFVLFETAMHEHTCFWLLLLFS
jgi:hypothetical protein